MKLIVRIDSVFNIDGDCLMIPLFFNGNLLDAGRGDKIFQTYWDDNCKPFLKSERNQDSQPFFLHPAFDIPPFKRFLVYCMVTTDNLDFLRRYLLACLEMANKFKLKRVTVLTYFYDKERQVSINYYLKALEEFKSKTDLIFIEELTFNVNYGAGFDFFDMLQKSISEIEAEGKPVKQDGKRKLYLE